MLGTIDNLLDGQRLLNKLVGFIAERLLIGMSAAASCTYPVLCGSTQVPCDCGCDHACRKKRGKYTTQIWGTNEQCAVTCTITGPCEQCLSLTELCQPC